MSFGQNRKCDYVLLMRWGSGGGVGGERVGIRSGARRIEVERMIKECGGSVSRGMLNGGEEQAVNPFGSMMFYTSIHDIALVLRPHPVDSLHVRPTYPGHSVDSSAVHH